MPVRLRSHRTQDNNHNLAFVGLLNLETKGLLLRLIHLFLTAVGTPSLVCLKLKVKPTLALCSTILKIGSPKKYPLLARPRGKRKFERKASSSGLCGI